MAESTEAQGQVTEDQGPGNTPATASDAPKAESKQQTDKSQPKQAKDKGPSPWLKDLEGLGLNPEHVPSVDEYLRTQWQPRMTEFEQQVAEWSNLFGGDMERAQIMANIANALEEDPAGTYRQIGELLELVDSETDGDALPVGDEGDMGDPEGEDTGEPDPRQQFLDELMEQHKQQQADAMYERMMDGIREEFPGLDEDLFNTALLAHGGDVAGARAWYAPRHQPLRTPDEPPPSADEPPAPTPPAREKPASISDAVNRWMSDREVASRPA